jgi:hypothetical protein
MGFGPISFLEKSVGEPMAPSISGERRKGRRDFIFATCMNMGFSLLQIHQLLDIQLQINKQI